MKKIKNFLGKRFDGDILVFITIFLVIAAVSIGGQSLLLWIGGLFPSVAAMGLVIDSVLGLVLVLPAAVIAKSGGAKVMALALIGIYVCVVWYFDWFLLIARSVVLLLGLRKLAEYADTLPLFYNIACLYLLCCLLYCIGAYFAMICNGLEPEADIIGIAVILVLVVCVRLIPAFGLRKILKIQNLWKK